LTGQLADIQGFWFAWSGSWRQAARLDKQHFSSMKIETHQVNDTRIAEVISTDMVIRTIEDGSDLLGNLYYQDYDKIIVHQENITSEFFDLKTGIAGEILQKFSNYRVRLAIVGDFSQYSGKSFNAFIFESNKVGQINFVSSVSEALSKLSKQ
jgi:hypothetical protein